MVRYLVEEVGLDVNALDQLEGSMLHSDNYWGTPLCYVAQSNPNFDCSAVLKYLLEKGADPRLITKPRGCNAVELAKREKNWRFVEIVEKWEAGLAGRTGAMGEASNGPEPQSVTPANGFTFTYATGESSTPAQSTPSMSAQETASTPSEGASITLEYRVMWPTAALGGSGYYAASEFSSLLDTRSSEQGVPELTADESSEGPD
jgi:hypothetical protein